MTAKTIRLPKYQGILSEEGAFWREESEDRWKYIEELAFRYGISEDDCPFDTSRLITDPTVGDAERLETVFKLVIALASEIVPAFRKPKRKRGGKPKTRNLTAFQRASHAARLIEIVHALQAKRRRAGGLYSRVAAYGDILGFLKANPQPGWLYGTLQKKSGFTQAWKAIPKVVLADPSRFLHAAPVDLAEFLKLWGSLPENRGRDQPSLLEIATDFHEPNRREWLYRLPKVEAVLKFAAGSSTV